MDNIWRLLHTVETSLVLPLRGEHYLLLFRTLFTSDKAAAFKDKGKNTHAY